MFSDVFCEMRYIRMVLLLLLLLLLLLYLYCMFAQHFYYKLLIFVNNNELITHQHYNLKTRTKDSAFN